MQKEEDYELGIDPYPINETEARLITLLLTLLKYPQGLSLEKIRIYMKDHYSNPNENSDWKKLNRDMEELHDLGFPAYYDKETETYRILSQLPESKIQFTKEELKAISVSLIQQNNTDEYSQELYSLAQKIFTNDWELYPYFPGEKKQKEESHRVRENIEILLQAIKSKISLKMVYERSYGIPKNKEIDPIQIVRKNSTDLYLYAFDREKKDYRHYLIPCIKTLENLDIKHWKNHQAEKFETINHKPKLHALNFLVEDPQEVSIEVSESGKHAIHSYLESIDYSIENRTYTFQTTNPKALFPFLLKLGRSVLKVEPESFNQSYIQFLDEMYTMHSRP